MAADPIEPLDRADLRKRRRREIIAVVIATATLIAFALAQSTLPPLASRTSLAANIIVILLFDLSFLLLGLLLFLVGRNLAKVIFERRRGFIGSKLQARLVAGFIAVSIVPAAFLLYVSGSFLRADVDSWFNPHYKRILDESVEIAQTYYLSSANSGMHFARELAQQVSARGLIAPNRRADLKKFIESKQVEYNLGTIEVFSADRRLVLIALSAKTPTGIGVSPDSQLLVSTLKGQGQTRTDRLGKADVIRGSAPIYTSPDSDTIAGAIVVDFYIPRSLSKPAADISRSGEEYFQLRVLRQPILRSYMLALLLIGLVVVLLASWFGMMLARGITGPIKLLAEGTQAVASGDLEHRIPPVGDDEMGHLVASFNQMTADLRASAAELERRRSYTETLLRNVPAGVVGLDADGAVTTYNPGAERLLGRSFADVIGCNYRDAFPARLANSLDDIRSRLMFERRVGASRDGETAISLRPEVRSSITLDIGAGETEMMVTASPLGDGADLTAGTVLFFEDVSQIAKVERMEAWREVARRIAHEIKNPLTPIQLSAERLQRHLTFARGASDPAIVDECTRTIVVEVEGLKRLVGEFAAFARLPRYNPVQGDLNALVDQTVHTFKEVHPEVEIAADLAPDLPPIAIDRAAVKRAFVNLLDNAAAIIPDGLNGQPPRVEVRTRLDTASGTVTLEVADNGPGVPPRLRTRIFEPYFSTRKGGTGLGLAIVSAVMTDHHGFVRLGDNQPRGSRFILEFPLETSQPAELQP